jgi:predicted nucleotide-binding protein (sugar kinase/HSP70/actin superfamily)
MRTCGAVKLPKGAPKVALPRALLTYSHLPLWRRFFGELGIDVVLSKPTNDLTKALSEDLIGSEYCYPVKIAHGHVRELAMRDDVRYIFLPHIVLAEPHDDGFKRSVFCPYNVAFPSIAKVAEIAEAEGKTILSPVVNFQFSIDVLAEKLVEGLMPAFDLNRSKVKAAWMAALEAHREFQDKLVEAGSRFLKRIEEEGGTGVVVLGRAYNVCDAGMNLSLPHKIADMGITVLPVDMLPLAGIGIDPLYKNMYWRYGRKMLQAATLVAGRKDLNAVFMTNFSCGPDSFMQTYVEKIMKGKPMLLLELDEHSADAGYITRLEAFRDVIEKNRTQNSEYRTQNTENRTQKTEIGKQNIDNIWLPPMHPYGTPLLAASMRSVGLPVRPLPTESLETFEMAKRYCRGTECVPAPSTIGAFLKVLRDSKDPSRECFFMPTAKGPCRFGQYSTLHRMILDEAGYKTTPIESWDDGSGTFGLTMTASKRMFGAIVAGDLLYKARCRIRPYATDRSSFDRTMEGIIDDAIATFENASDIGDMLSRAAKRLSAIETRRSARPLVGIVGEIYVRSNLFTNGHLVETIEDAGGEAWPATTTEWFQYLNCMDRRLGKDRGESIGTRLKKSLKRTYMLRQARLLTSRMNAVIADRAEPSIEGTLACGERVFPIHFDGESILTVGRALEFAEAGVDLIINVAPFGCMPGTLTSGIFQKLEAEMKVPVVSLFFDGETDLRHLVRTYMANIVNSKR